MSDHPPLDTLHEHGDQAIHNVMCVTVRAARTPNDGANSRRREEPSFAMDIENRR